MFHFLGGSIRSRSASSIAMDIFEQHQGTHILQVSSVAKHAIYFMVVKIVFFYGELIFYVNWLL